MRVVLGVVVGFVVFAAVMFAIPAPLYLVFGEGLAFREGTVEFSVAWMGVGLMTGALGALLGGNVCARLAGMRPGLASTILAAVILATGLASAVFGLQREPPDPVPDDIALVDAMELGIQPPLFAFTMPLVIALCVFPGAKKVPEAG